MCVTDLKKIFVSVMCVRHVHTCHRNVITSPRQRNSTLGTFVCLRWVAFLAFTHEYIQYHKRYRNSQFIVNSLPYMRASVQQFSYKLQVYVWEKQIQTSKIQTTFSIAVGLLCQKNYQHTVIFHFCFSQNHYKMAKKKH